VRGVRVGDAKSVYNVHIIFLSALEYLTFPIGLWKIAWDQSILNFAVIADAHLRRRSGIDRWWTVKEGYKMNRVCV
jgi:hypothetical protein